MLPASLVLGASAVRPAPFEEGGGDVETVGMPLCWRMASLKSLYCVAGGSGE